MFSDVRKRAKKAGQPPGTAIYTGDKNNRPATVTVINYDANQYQERIVQEVKPGEFKNEKGIIWINVEGLHDITLIEQIAHEFNLHPLTIEDILNVEQRAKVEEFDGYLFIALKVLQWDNKTNDFTIQQLSLILGEGFLLSFQELDTNLFDSIQTRLAKTANQRLRTHGSDYLAYRLIDTVIDEYFVVLERLGESIEKIEERIIASPTPQTIRIIYRLRRQLLFLRKAIWPMREAISHLLHVEDNFITPFTKVYLRDVYDHSVQTIDTLETFRDMLASLLDMYLSSITNRMSEIMKTLTIITTIFIPITAIASIYGMNFQYLPGLHWYWGFMITLGVMVAIAIAMLIYFRRKKWI